MGIQRRFRRQARAAVFLGGLACGAVLVRGGTPMLTDDPSTVEYQHWQVDLAATTVNTHSSRQSDLPSLDIGYGIGKRMQFDVQFSWLVHKDDDLPAVSGISNPVFSWKWRFHDLDESSWRMAIAPEFEIGRSGSKSAELGLIQRGVGVGMPLLFEKTLGRWALDIDVGYFYQSEGEDEIDYGVSIGTFLKPGVQVIAEVHGNSAARFNGGAVAVNFGASFDIGKRYSFQVSVGREVFNDEGERATLLAYVGWQTRL